MFYNNNNNNNNNNHNSNRITSLTTFKDIEENYSNSKGSNDSIQTIKENENLFTKSENLTSQKGHGSKKINVRRNSFFSGLLWNNSSANKNQINYSIYQGNFKQNCINQNFFLVFFQIL